MIHSCIDVSRSLFRVFFHYVHFGLVKNDIECWKMWFVLTNAGGYPSGIRNLQQLKVLDLHSNGLWGDIQDFFSELRNVDYVDLSYNMFSGSLSMEVTNISSLANTVSYVNLSNNELSGGFFTDDTISLFRNLRVLDLGGNQLTGQLPSFGSLPNLRVLRLGNNQLFGLIPEELLETSVPLQELDLSGNGFSGKKLFQLVKYVICGRILPYFLVALCIN